MKKEINSKLAIAIVALVASALSHVKENTNQREIVGLILNRIGLILLVFIAVFGFKASAQLNIVNVDVRMQTKWLVSVYYLYRESNGLGPIGLVANTGAKTLTIISIICLFLTIAAIILAVNEKKNKNKIIYYGVILILSIVVGVMLQSAVKKMLDASKFTIGYTAAFGGANVVNITLSAIALILTCVSMKLAPVSETKKIAENN